MTCQVKLVVQMQCNVLFWILEYKKDISGENGEI